MVRSSGKPNASPCFPAWPAPRPSRNRPPLISSIVSTTLAVRPAFLWSAERTQVPISIVDVAAATAAVIETHSQKPRGPGHAAGRQSNSSGIRTVSNPISSASSACSRIALHGTFSPVGTVSNIGRTMPSFSGRIGGLPLAVRSLDLPWALVPGHGFAADGSDPVGDPLLRRLEPMAIGRSAGMDLGEAGGFDPHLLTPEQAGDP